ncbi:hypothetical protein [Ancylobacter defluvii]|uniref:Uncharacterized protein n=1 Tax=Ancylobacter defluvii TaxID=1282440 RepID=A0A9W6K2P9_9HYPH|nr:hypothetical protein [Ancylobacter defluvii]MBS7588249.1 hypothetical protein [Ancylobacter defluvii]GLK86645.1 hypothetical protein GCM10017653_47150 [Ancylobacter defluvii]
MHKVKLVDRDVDLLHTTERGAKVRDHESGKVIWVPLASCEVVPNDEGTHHVLTISETLAIEKELF